MPQLSSALLFKQKVEEERSRRPAVCTNKSPTTRCWQVMSPTFQEKKCGRDAVTDKVAGSMAPNGGHSAALQNKVCGSMEFSGACVNF